MNTGTLFDDESAPNSKDTKDTPPESTHRWGVTTARQRIQLTERDASVLRWIAEQDIVMQDVVQQLLGRASSGTKRHFERATGAPLALRNTNRIIARWKAEELIEERKKFAHRPKYYWVTAKGMWEMGLPYHVRRQASQRWDDIDHCHEINRVRLWMENGSDGLLKLDHWYSERALRANYVPADDAEKSGQRAHTPDAIIEAQIKTPKGWRAGRVALEIELSEKGKARLSRITNALNMGSEQDAVWYFVNERAGADVIEAVKHNSRFTVYDVATFKRLWPL